MRTIAFFSALLSITCLLGGCAASAPQVKLQDRTTSVNDLDSATNRVIVLKDEFRKNLESQYDVSALSRLGVLGGALGAATSAIYKAHRDTILGFGLIGATSYSLGTLYSPAVYSEIYEAGLAATHCLDSFAAPAAALMPLIGKGQRLLDAAVSQLTNIQLSGSKREQEAKTVLASGQRIAKRASDYMAKEPILASKIVLAAEEIAQTANRQLRLNTPNLEAFSVAGRSVYATVMSSMPSPQPPPPPTNNEAEPKTSTPPKATTPPLSDRQEQAILASMNTVQEAERSLAAQLDAFDKLGEPQVTGCLDKAKLDAARPLDVSVSELKMNSGEFHVITVSGGRPPYRPVGWIGLAPAPDKLEDAPMPYSSTAFKFTAKKSLGSAVYKYRIEDNEKNSRDITITSAEPLKSANTSASRKIETKTGRVTNAVGNGKAKQ